ncbi:insulin receptor-related [Pelobates cultripes]|uniref:Tyrosine-protein kinase receptor n=1 Tax=Pelobates cultripes TaxID=61616 RepID=A0AAD1TK27_PELCU|nr:insulin receptor-related [Pelobates cultripes]
MEGAGTLIGIGGLKQVLVIIVIFIIQSESADFCGSMDIRNDVSQFQKLENCTVIQGNLQILLMFSTKPEDFRGLSFPRLTMITEYLLLFRVYGLESLRELFPNLSVIRGTAHFFHYSLVIYEMPHLRDMGLHSLTNILRGAVRIERNQELCHIFTIDWALLSDSVENHYIVGNKAVEECADVCPGILDNVDSCVKTPVNGITEPRCWTSINCQKELDEGRTRATCRHSRDCQHIWADAHMSVMCILACTDQELLHGESKRQEGSCTREVLQAIQGANDMRLKEMEERYYSGMLKLGRKSEGCSIFCNTTGSPGKRSCSSREGEIDGFLPTGWLDAKRRIHGCPQVGCLPTPSTPPSTASPSEAETVADALQLWKTNGLCERFNGWAKGPVQERLCISPDLYASIKLLPRELQTRGVSTSSSVSEQRLQVLGTVGSSQMSDPLAALFSCVQPRFRLAQYHVDRKSHTENTRKVTYFILLSNLEQPSCRTQSLRFSGNTTEADRIILRWERYQPPDFRDLLSFIIHYKESPFQNVTEYMGQDACGANSWNVLDVELPLSNDQEPGAVLTNLKPWTQYAIYVRAITLATTEDGHNFGAQSDVVYIRTKPAAPTVPQDVIIMSNSSTNLIVRWKPPTQRNGNITYYLVLWQQMVEDQELYLNDYCTKGLKLPTSSADTRFDSYDNGNQDANQDSEDKCCPCQKNGGQLVDLDEGSFQKKFENFLRNTIFIPKSPRQRRHVTSLFGENQGNFSLLEGTVSHTVNHSIWDSKPYSYKDKIFQNWMVISNLKHFTEYRIDIHACNHAADIVGCSAATFVFARTMPDPQADNIVGNITWDLMGKSSILMKWVEPQNPNALILKYEIKYKRDHEEGPSTVVCVSRQRFQKYNGVHLSLLQPGNYSARIRATSLAGNGSWTEPTVFFILGPEEEQSENLYLLLKVMPIVLLLIIILLAVFVFFYNKKGNGEGYPPGTLYASVNPEYLSATDMYVADEWEFPREKITIIKELGQGSFGMVYEGVAKDIVKDEPVTKVALKTVNELASTRERIEFLNEASVMKAFLCHHVVRLLGVVSQGQPALVIMELMTRGDLKSYLRSLRPEDENNSRGSQPSLKRMIQMTGEIADGMAYLNAKKFVHRDLAARNCMVSEDLTVKIGDFGMTRDIYETDYYRKGGKSLLPVRWMSPESLKDGIFTPHSDVWSFGVVLWEIATLAEQPYQGLANEQVLHFVIDNGTLEKPENCPDRLHELMTWCWQKNPKQRPTFIQILESIKNELHPTFRKVSFFYQGDHKRRESEASDTEADQSQKALLDQTPPAPPFNNFSSLCTVQKIDLLNAIYGKMDLK